MTPLSIPPLGLAALLVFGPPEDVDVAAAPKAEANESSSASASESASESVEATQKVTSDGETTTVEGTSNKASSTDAAAAGPAGPPPGADPNAAPPKPAPPPDGVGAVGSGVQSPLPPPKPPVDPSTIRTGPWRGTGWISLRLIVEGPLGGELPARSRVTAIGGGGELGWRVNNWLGIAAGMARRPHDQVDRQVQDELSGEQVKVRYVGHLTSFDFAIARLYWPAERRFQPFVDLGGGLSIVEPPDPEDAVLLGGHMRSAVGFDAWIARTVTLGAGLVYRANFVEDSTGHSLGGFAEFGLHW